MKRKYILPALLFVQIVLVNMMSFFPEFVEAYYSNGIYLWISSFSRIALGWLPFSIGDIIYFIVIFLLLRWFWRQRKTWRSQWKDNLLQILSVLSVAYFMFHILWAASYHRVPLFEKMEISREYTDADLLAFTKKLIAKSNALHSSLTINDTLKVVFPYTRDEIFEKNLDGYDALANQYPFFAYEHPSVKKSIISLPLTYMGFAGYLNPFTNEAQVNYKLPLYTFPTVTCHEMAHQLGYASESEANLLAIWRL